MVSETRGPADAILGAAVRLQPRDVAVFLRSARAHMPAERVRIALWAEEADLPKFRHLAALGVEFVTLRNRSGPSIATIGRAARIFWTCRSMLAIDLARLLAPRALADRVRRDWANPAISRFIYFLDYLERHPEIERVLLCDVRDVAFQDDLFARRFETERLHVGEEPTRIEGSQLVARWCRRSLGRAKTEALGPLPLMCVGALLGGRAPVLHFLEHYRAALRRHWAILWGLDTAILLDYLYNHLGSDRFVAMDNHHGDLVVTREENIEDYPQLNRSGQRFAAMHMYDRKPVVAAKLRRLFGS